MRPIIKHTNNKKNINTNEMFKFKITDIYTTIIYIIYYYGIINNIIFSCQSLSSVRQIDRKTHIHRLRLRLRSTIS